MSVLSQSTIANKISFSGIGIHTGKAFFDESSIPEEESDLLDVNLKLDATECKQRDVISFTVIVSEMKDGMEIDRRGVSTVIHIV